MILSNLLATLVVLSPIQQTTANEADYLTRLEADIVREHNLLRRNPAAYAEYVDEWTAWFDPSDTRILQIPGRTRLRTREGSDATREASQALRTTDARPELRPSQGMSRGAKDHTDSQRGGGMGHTGDDGSLPWDRVARYGQWSGTIAENISYGGYGEADARLIVLSLVVDDGVNPRGHRDNILNEAFNVIGVGCGRHETYETVCVITYAGEYEEGR